MLNELSAKLNVDSRRIFVTGFCNGASMTFRFDAEASKRMAAITPVAGACWLEKVTLERSVLMCYLTGTADPLNLIEGNVPKMRAAAPRKSAPNQSRGCAIRFGSGLTRWAFRRRRAAQPKPMASTSNATATTSCSSPSPANVTHGPVAKACCRSSWSARQPTNSTQPTSPGNSSASASERRNLEFGSFYRGFWKEAMRLNQDRRTPRLAESAQHRPKTPPPLPIPQHH